MEADYQRQNGGGGFAFSGGRPVAAPRLGSRSLDHGGGLNRTGSLDNSGGATTRTWSSNHGGGAFGGGLTLTTLGTLRTGKTACGSFAACCTSAFSQGGGGKAIGGGPRGGNRSPRGRQQSKIAPICKTSWSYQSNYISSRVLVRQQTIPRSHAVARG